MKGTVEDQRRWIEAYKAREVVVRSTPTMNHFVAIHIDDLPRVWKPSTASSNESVWRINLAPHFGDILVADITKADVVRWRRASPTAAEA